MADEFTERRARDAPDFEFLLSGRGVFKPNGKICWHFWFEQDSTVPANPQQMVEALQQLIEALEKDDELNGTPGPNTSEHPG